jgi:hypothetical protein
MRIARNEKGVALVLVLILALIGLAMVSALIFMVTQGTTLSGAMRFYHTADEASVSAAEFTAEYILNRGSMQIIGYTSGCNCGDPAIYTDNTDLNVIGNPRTCRCDKICNPTAQYNAGAGLCNDEDAGTGGLQISVDPSANFDGSVVLGLFTVTYKIVDTVEGNTASGGIVSSGDLTGSGVVASSGGTYSPPHFPYLYRVEVMARRTLNPRERARTSMLYGF